MNFEIKKPVEKESEKKKTIANNATQKKEFGLYYIDLKHFKNNILSVKYIKNKNVVPSFRSIVISSELKPILTEMIELKYIDKSKYNKLSKEDKRIINNFSKFLDIETEKNDDDEEFEKQYQILLGEVMAKNDNPQIKSKLRKYIMMGLNEGKISKTNAFNLIMQLNL